MATTAPTGLFRVFSHEHSRRGRRRRRKKEEEGVYLNKGVLLSVGDVWGDIRTQFHVLWAGSFTTLIRFVLLLTLLFGFPEVFWGSCVVLHRTAATHWTKVFCYSHQSVYICCRLLDQSLMWVFLVVFSLVRFVDDGSQQQQQCDRVSAAVGKLEHPVGPSSWRPQGNVSVPFPTRKSELYVSAASSSSSLEQVSQLMNTRIGQYLSSHPVLALAVMLFGAMAALPVGLFLTFALVTITVSAVGFVFFEGRCNPVQTNVFFLFVFLWHSTWQCFYSSNHLSLFLSAVLLFVGGVSLLCVLSGIAFFSVVVSFIFNVFYIAVSTILKSYYPHLTKVMCWRRVILL